MSRFSSRAQKNVINSLKVCNQQQQQYQSSFTEKLTQHQQPSQQQKIPKHYPKSPFLHQPNLISKSHGVTNEFKCLNADRPKHKKGKSMDMTQLAGFNYPGIITENKQQIINKDKVVVNSQFIQQLRGRSNMSQMNYYSTKLQHMIEPKICKAKKKKSKVDFAEQLKKGIKQTHILPFKKKQKQNNKKILKQSSATFSTKLNKPDLKNIQFVNERRCKSSLKDKKNHKMLDELKSIGNSLPLVSKFNSLYSNTSSIYNSHSDLDIFMPTQSMRIPTEIDMQQIPEIRKYQSMRLTEDRSIHSLRNVHHKCLVKQVYSEPASNKTTEEIINHYLNIFKSTEAIQITQPKSLQQINEIYKETSLKELISRQNSISLIEILSQNTYGQKLDAQKSLKTQNLVISKLDEIMNIIQNDESIFSIQSSQKKKLVIKTIRQLIQNKTNPSNQTGKQQVKSLSQKELIVSSKSQINTSQLKDSIGSQTDISILNLQILDKALREREQYLVKQLEKQVSALEHLQKDTIEQVQKVTKWINNQIRQVSRTRMQLWAGFNNAKNLLSGELLDKKNEMMHCLSDKYLKYTSHQQKEKENLCVCKQQSINVKEIDIDNLSPKVQQILQEQVSLTPLIENDRFQMLSFLSSNKQKIYDNDSYQQQQSHYIEQFSNPLEQKVIYYNTIQFQQNLSPEPTLKRQIKMFKSDIMYSDSQNQGYEDSISFLKENLNYSLAKLRNLDINEKQDICEFIFLDLSLQIINELKAQSKIVKSLINFINKAKHQSEKKKGFKTNTNSVKEYILQFISFLKNKPQILIKIHTSLDKPMGPTALQILRYMHTNNQNAETDEEMESSYILTAQYFDLFEDVHLKGLEIQEYFEDEEKQKKRRNFIKNAIHIHNKAIYDAFNQSLDKERPFGLWGVPFSWKKRPKFHRGRDQKQKNDCLVKCAQKTIECSVYMCGFMVDKQECSFKDNPSVTQEYIEQIRYDRLSRMLANDLAENEQRMLFIDDQQTQMLVDIGIKIFDHLVVEILEELRLIF